MPQGILFVTVRASDSAFPVANSRVTVLGSGGEVLGEDTVTSAGGGVSRDFSLDAPEKDLSLSPGEIQPYSTYNVQIEAEGFYTVLLRGVQIFADQRSQLPVEMIPRGQSADEVLVYDIAPHGLCTATERNLDVPTGEERVLSRVFIPERITVHLGTPSSSAPNVTVPFVDYIKNVASSEIYPTWPERSLRANILCQISLALNRIFTEWYPSRGYNFNITNSTAYDQYFVYGRNIYDSISRIVDEIFNNYIRRPGRIDPFYAEYCDGSSVTCAGLSQWGTVTLAQEGLSVEEILQFYYGNVEIVETNDIRAIESSYPGSPLRVGSSGASVRTIQQQLNRIRVNYPSIPAIEQIDGVFGARTRAAVEAFQRIFDLTVDGVVGKSTWYRISYIYVAVKKLAELNSEGERPQYDDNSFPGILSFGDTGTGVQNLQLYLKTIAAFNPFLPDLAIDGRFGRSTENAVRAFQEYYGLFVDGVVGENTWNRLVSVYLDITESGRITIRNYPGDPVRFGESGDDVLYVQILLNRIRPVLVTIPELSEDGIYGPRMRTAVREFQRLFGLETDGVVGRQTWNALNRTFGSIASGCLDDGDTETGRILRYGSEGQDVRSVQNRLNLIHGSIVPVPRVSVDGKYGRRTEEAVTVFQRIFGLAADGVVGNATRTRLGTIARAVENGCLPTVGARLLAREEEETAPVWREERRDTGLWPEGCLWAEEATPEPRAGAEEYWEYREYQEEEEMFVPFGVGSLGEGVKQLKYLLRQKGYGDPFSYGEKELFGKETERAVFQFQKDAHLPETGVVDFATWRALWE